MRIIFLFLSILFTQNSMASTLKLNYSLFFSYMKTEYKLDYQYVTTAFYLVDRLSGENCLIEEAEIVVDEKREQITFEKQGRLLPFFSDQHRKDGAILEVKVTDKQTCDLQVTLMAKPSQLNTLTFEKLALMSAQLEGVLRKNAGMIGKYFLPTYSGLRFKTNETIPVDTQFPSGYSLAKNGDLLITNQAIKESDPVKSFNYNVSRITPWIGE